VQLMHRLRDRVLYVCDPNLITEKDIFEEGFSKHFQNYVVSNFKEANKKLIIVCDSEKLLTDLENHQSIP
jgi:hypothetical protein